MYDHEYFSPTHVKAQDTSHFEESTGCSEKIKSDTYRSALRDMKVQTSFDAMRLLQRSN